MLREIRGVCTCKITHSAFDSFIFDMLCVGVSFYALVSSVYDERAEDIILSCVAVVVT